MSASELSPFSHFLQEICYFPSPTCRGCAGMRRGVISTGMHCIRLGRRRGTARPLALRCKSLFKRPRAGRNVPTPTFCSLDRSALSASPRVCTVDSLYRTVLRDCKVRSALQDDRIWQGARREGGCQSRVRHEARRSRARNRSMNTRGTWARRLALRGGRSARAGGVGGARRGEKKVVRRE